VFRPKRCKEYHFGASFRLLKPSIVQSSREHGMSLKRYEFVHRGKDHPGLKPNARLRRRHFT
jgi:hypothetical protein